MACAALEGVTSTDRWIRYYNEERPHQSLGYVAH
ncbi:MAG: integrase core domain-containing protein [Pseudomonadota bacterium]